MKKGMFLAMFFIILFSGLTALTANAAEIFKAITFLPADNLLNQYAKIWIDRMNQIDPKVFTVKYLGGPEVIPANDQAEALRKGIVQIALPPTAYYGAMLPEAEVTTLSNYEFWEERTKESGFYDLMVERHKKINMRYLGRYMWGEFHLWFKKPFRSLEDLKGRRMRSTHLYDQFMRELGMVPVTVPHTDTYTALERGLAVGFGFPILGARDHGWPEMCKYVMDHGFFQMNCVILMNLDIWEKLSSETKTKIETMTESCEREMVTWFKKIIQDERKVLNDKFNVQFLTLPPDDAKKFLNTVYEIEWLKLKGKVSEELYKKLRQVAIKGK